METLALAMPALADQFGPAAAHLPSHADDLCRRLRDLAEQIEREG